MAETQTYSYAEIQRYLQHKMSAQEMHAFEKALMNDPFLADALEGFSVSEHTLAEEHLAGIERSLTHNQQKAKVVPLRAQKAAWWKVAAVILVIVSAGVLTYAVLNTNNVTDKSKLVTETVRKTATIEKDSIGPVEKTLAQVELPVRNQSLPKAKNTSPIIRAEAIEPLAYKKQSGKDAGEIPATNNENASLIAPSAPAAVIADKEVTAVKAMKLQDEQVVIGYGTLKKSDVISGRVAGLSVAQNEFKGKVVDKTGNPLPYANIKANNSSIAATSDANGNFNLKASDSMLDVAINAPGYVAALATIKSNKTDNKITLKEDELSLAEVVLTNLFEKRKSNKATVHADSSIAAEPVGGWKSFKQYLNQQLDSLKSNEEDQNFTDDIVLEFSLDKQGTPTHIKAPAEMDKIMADKAIQILSNGPKWKNKQKDKKVKVTIAF